VGVTIGGYLSVFVILPFLVFVFIFLIFCMKLSGHEDLSVWRVSFLSASMAWGVLVVGITEILSIFNLITFNWLVGCWVAIGVLSGFFCFILVIQKKLSIHFVCPKFQWLEILLLLGVVFIVMVLCLIALVAPPNTWDSMTYHMSRVSHWVQNHNVAYYPTHILRQLFMQPFAEFTILHFQILGGGDRFANLVQWFSMVGSLIGVSLIARQLGANLSSQIFSVIVCSTIPMGILQSSSTQNDYVVAFWLVCFLYFLILLRTQPKWVYSLATGISLGLALLTKATAYIYAFPFILWFILSGFKRFRRKLWKLILTMVIVVLLINFGHYMRNVDLYGHPLGGSEEFKDHTNSAMSVPLLLSNIIRNVSLHMGTPGWVANAIVLKTVKFLHTILNVSIDDPRTTFSRVSNRFVINFSTNESITGNILHFLLIMASIILLISKPKDYSWDLKNYCLAIVIAFMLFAFYVKCQTWAVRLHLPLFVLWSPFIAIVLSRINSFKGKRILLIFMGIVLLCAVIGWFLFDYFVLKFVETSYKGLTTDGNVVFYLKVNLCLLLGILLLYRFNLKVSYLIGFILILTSAPWVFHNSYKNLIGEENIFNTGRTDQYFLAMPGFKDPYIGVVDYLKSKRYSDIGVVLGENCCEYPLFVLLKENNTHAFRIEHINVTNISSRKYEKYSFKSFSPSAVISVTPAGSDEIHYKDVIYVKERSFHPVRIFIRR
jgi:4-amino-4-deoxy-L-arabinose transferase-like glycosyltransferase